MTKFHSPTNQTSMANPLFVKQFGRGPVTGLAEQLWASFKPTDLQHMKNLLKMTTREKWNEQAAYNLAKFFPDVARLIVARAKV